jgi:hypothetical protein
MFGKLRLKRRTALPPVTVYLFISEASPQTDKVCCGGDKHRPHPEEHRTEVGLTRLRQLKRDRNRQQPISMAMRPEALEGRSGTSQCLGPSFETAAQKCGLLKDEVH